MERVDIDVNSLANDTTEEQHALQLIYENKIADASNGVDTKSGQHIQISLTPAEFERVCDFFEMFAYS